MIEVRRFGAGRAAIFVIDGEPLPLREAAERLGIKPRALAQRVQRGSRIDQPPAHRGNWGSERPA